MRRVLIVANQTVAHERLLKAVQQLAAEEPSEFEIVVPATPLTNQEAALHHSEHLANPGETGAFDVAARRLQASIEAFAKLGIVATGDVGDPHPMKAVASVMTARPADLIVVSTLHRLASKWLKMGLPQRMRRKYDIPVRHVEADAGPASSGRAADGSPAVAPYHASHR